MRRSLVALLVLSACAGGGQSQPNATPSSMPSSTAAPTSVSTVAQGAGPAASDTAPTVPSTSTLVTSTTAVGADVVLPAGFDLVAARVTAADGTTCDLCLWLADTGDRRRKGLMTVTDLGPADGMAFVYPSPTTTRFWMKNTAMPLSIAFYGVDGVFLDSFDMDPCVADDDADCLRYPTPPDFVVAVETNQGGLTELDMFEGSTLELLDLPCQSGGGG